MALTAKQRVFVAEYLVDQCGTQAAIRAGYSPKSAKHIAYDNLQKPEVVAAISVGMAERMQRIGLDADSVLTMHRLVAEADPTELVEFRRGCCRYCYGQDHLYQRTPAELGRDLKEFEKRLAEASGDEIKTIGSFDEQGGVGWNPKRDPVADCPECHGDGVGDIFIRDTRLLSPAARRLFAGVKQTKDGLQVLMNSQDRSRELLGQHLGLFKQVFELKPPADAAKPSNVDWLGHPLSAGPAPAPEAQS